MILDVALFFLLASDDDYCVSCAQLCHEGRAVDRFVLYDLTVPGVSCRVVMSSAD